MGADTFVDQQKLVMASKKKKKKKKEPNKCLNEQLVLYFRIFFKLT